MKPLAKQVMDKALDDTLASLIFLETNLKRLQKVLESAIEKDDEIWCVLHDLVLAWKGESIGEIVYPFLVDFGKELKPRSRIMRQLRERIDKELKEVRETIKELKDKKSC
ncbi:hypothetical protein DRH29_04875 [candidate division Kazan bacterium]|uniref:Uncharacterized protein n=1 Tax=candidate division Kazan bacterium TaxID=2202143 RepID=A0A420ZBI8_UNCK3|nr:MAG: hypothetical protein DRH29_04875 [candidate division Kazan bacterium]